MELNYSGFVWLRFFIVIFFFSHCSAVRSGWLPPPPPALPPRPSQVWTKLSFFAVCYLFIYVTATGVTTIWLGHSSSSCFQINENLQFAVPCPPSCTCLAVCCKLIKPLCSGADIHPLDLTVNKRLAKLVY